MAGHGYVEAEVAWAAREELALGVEDVLARRTRLAIEQEDQAVAAAPRVAQLLAAELDWGAQATDAELARYRSVAGREYSVPTRPAHRTTTVAPELRGVTG